MVLIWMHAKNFNFFSYKNLWFLIFFVFELANIHYDFTPEEYYPYFLYLNMVLSNIIILNVNIF